MVYRVFSLTWPAFMQIYWIERKHLHKKRVQLPEDWFGTPTWPPIHCFGTPIWPPWRHIKTLYWDSTYVKIFNLNVFLTCNITIQIKPLWQCFYVVLFVFQNCRKWKFGHFVNFDFGLSRFYTGFIRGSLLAYSDCMNTYRTFFFFLLFVAMVMKYRSSYSLLLLLITAEFLFSQIFIYGFSPWDTLSNAI